MGCARFVTSAPGIVEFVLGGFSHFNISICLSKLYIFIVPKLQVFVSSLEISAKRAQPYIVGQFIGVGGIKMYCRYLTRNKKRYYNISNFITWSKIIIICNITTVEQNERSYYLHNLYQWSQQHNYSYIHWIHLRKFHYSDKD